ncbi:hypothetical protein TGAM01_v200940, partial [Trichoderma gamsii]
PIRAHGSSDIPKRQVPLRRSPGRPPGLRYVTEEMTHVSTLTMIRWKQGESLLPVYHSSQLTHRSRIVQ